MAAVCQIPAVLGSISRGARGHVATAPSVAIGTWLDLAIPACGIHCCCLQCSCDHVNGLHFTAPCASDWPTSLLGSWKGWHQGHLALAEALAALHILWWSCPHKCTGSKELDRKSFPSLCLRAAESNFCAAAYFPGLRGLLFAPFHLRCSGQLYQRLKRSLRYYLVLGIQWSRSDVQRVNANLNPGCKYLSVFVL